MKALARLYLITGSPRSGTTYLHDVLIRCGIFNGKIADPLVHRSKSLQTNEYRPSFEPAVLYPFSRWKRSALLRKTTNVLKLLTREFSTVSGELMLKAPHYVYCMDAYFDILGHRVRFLFIKRNIYAVALSMARHPVISRQLQKHPKLSGDFCRGHLLLKSCIDTKWVHPHVMNFAIRYWDLMSVVERAFIKWHVFKRAFVISMAGLESDQYAFVDYEDIGSPKGIAVISRLFHIDAILLKKSLGDFDPIPIGMDPKDISSTGRKFCELCQRYVHEYE